jgi:uncharacterized membrane protein
MTRLRNFLVMLRGLLWLIPAAITLSGAFLAYLMLTVGDTLIPVPSRRLWWLYSGDADTARNLLSTLLSGLMTMTSLVVSVTFVILTLAANQLGPRLIAIFMADRYIQSVLGLFLGTIVYVLIVLRSLGNNLGAEGVPHIAVTVASALTLVCLFALLFYVHKIARSIIADTMVNRVATELISSVGAMMPLADQEAADEEPVIAREPIQTLSLDCSGYIQTVDYAALVAIACKHDAILRVRVRAGHFVLCNGAHVDVLIANKRLDDDAERAVRAAFVIGAERSPAQDLEYSVRQLVEIALRALSPGINDMFTAAAVVDRLAAALEQVVRRRTMPVYLRDAEGAVRVAADRTTYQGIVDAAFDPVRQASKDHPGLLIRIADSLGALAPSLDAPDARSAVLAQLGKLRETATTADLTPADHQVLIARIDEAERRLSSRPFKTQSDSR